jgi:hypothetical protein
MTREISESDWKLFRQFHPLALERFCEQVLADLGRLASDPGKSAHERYLAVQSRRTAWRWSSHDPARRTSPATGPR